MKIHDTVTALTDLDDGRVLQGARGEVIDVYVEPPGFEVEFELDDGWIAVSCDPHEIELATTA